MPYLPFPSTWPVYIPGRKLANFLESYASILELAVWRSANAIKVYRPESGLGWSVDVEVGGAQKTLKTNHVIFAMGFGSGRPFIPSIPGIVRSFLCKVSSTANAHDRTTLGANLSTLLLIRPPPITRARGSQLLAPLPRLMMFAMISYDTELVSILLPNTTNAYSSPLG
jgi:hypothetical protein